MKRTFYYILSSLVAILLFGGLVHTVLVAANVSEPSATTVYGPTPRRVWAIIVIVVALIGIVIGGLSQRGRIDTHKRRIMAIVAMIAGLIGVINGIINLATAEGGPGTGNGVVGSAMAIVLGAIGIGLGAIAFVRSERIAKGNKNQN